MISNSQNELGSFNQVAQQDLQASNSGGRKRKTGAVHDTPHKEGKFERMLRSDRPAKRANAPHKQEGEAKKTKPLFSVDKQINNSAPNAEITIAPQELDLHELIDKDYDPSEGIEAQASTAQALDNPTLSILTGTIPPNFRESMGQIITEDGFISRALSSDLGQLMKTPVKLNELSDMLGLAKKQSDELVSVSDQAGYISPSEAFKALGIDPHRVVAEISRLKNSILKRGFQDFRKNAVELDTDESRPKKIVRDYTVSNQREIDSSKEDSSRKTNLTQSKLSQTPPVDLTEHNRLMQAQAQLAEPKIKKKTATDDIQARIDPQSLESNNRLLFQDSQARPQYSIQPNLGPLKQNNTLMNTQNLDQTMPVDLKTPAPKSASISEDAMLQKNAALLQDSIISPPGDFKPSFVDPPIHDRIAQEVMTANQESEIPSRGLDLSTPAVNISWNENLSDPDTTLAKQLESNRDSAIQDGILHSQLVVPKKVLPKGSDLTREDTPQVLADATGVSTSNGQNSRPFASKKQASTQTADSIKKASLSALPRRPELATKDEVFSIDQDAIEQADSKENQSEDQDLLSGHGALGSDALSGDNRTNSDSGVSSPIEDSSDSRQEILDQLTEQSALLKARRGGQANISIFDKNHGQVALSIQLEGSDVNLKLLNSTEQFRQSFGGDVGQLRDIFASQNLNLANLDLDMQNDQNSDQQFNLNQNNQRNDQTQQQNFFDQDSMGDRLREKSISEITVNQVEEKGRGLQRISKSPIDTVSRHIQVRT